MQAAAELGLSITGVLGILRSAKRQGLIAEVKKEQPTNCLSRSTIVVRVSDRLTHQLNFVPHASQLQSVFRLL